MRTTLLSLPEAHTTFTQDGLLGLALHPDLLKGLVGSDYVYIAFTYDDAPGPALARRLGIRRYQYEAKSADVIQADGRHYGTSDARRSRRRQTRHRSRSEAVSHHRRSGQQLRRKPLQCESRAGPPHTEPGEGARTGPTIRARSSTESRRVDPRRQSADQRRSQSRLLLRSSQPAGTRRRTEGRDATNRSTVRTPTTRST